MMHAVAVDTTPGVTLSFSPVNLKAGQTSTVTITAAIPNLAAGTGGSAQAAYTCGSFGPPIPIAISLLGIPEPPCDCGHGGGGAGGDPPSSSVGGPVNVTTGAEHYSKTDVTFSGPFGMSFKRVYDSLLIGSQTISGTTYGPNDLGSAYWQTNYDAYLYNDSSTNRFVFHDEDGEYHYLTRPAGNGSSQYSSISGMTAAISGNGQQWTVTDFGNQQYTFNTLGHLIAIRDRVGNVQTVTRDSLAGHGDRILNVSDPLGRKMCYFYDGTNRIVAVLWQAAGSCPSSVSSNGTIVKLRYDSGTNCTTGQLCSVTEPDGHTWTYQYNTGDPSFPNGLTAIVDPLGHYEERNTYAGQQVVVQASGNCASAFPCADTGDYLRLQYPANGSNQTIVTDGAGRNTTFTFDQNTYQIQSVSGPLCNCGGDQTRSFSYDGSERLISRTDNANGTSQHTVTFSYGRDANGSTYPNPTMISENVDTAGATRSIGMQYYPVGDPRQDLPMITQYPSVDQPGQLVTTTDYYSTSGLLTQRSVRGSINGTFVTYSW